jgi:hypothetical protein
MPHLCNQHSLSSNSSTPSASKSPSHGEGANTNTSFAMALPQASLNAALAALAAQYPAAPFLIAQMNQHAAPGPSPNPMHSLMTNLLSGLINKEPSAGNCYNLE